MKKRSSVLYALLFVLVPTFLFAAVPAKMTVNGEAVEGVVAPAVSYNGHGDTLIGEDSLWIYKGLVPELGYEYVVQVGSITGDGADSVAIYLYVDCYYGSTKIKRFKADSIVTAAAAAGQTILLPLGQTSCFGTKYNVLMKTYTDHGGEADLNNLCMFKRRVISSTKNITY
jgi:hypothetical protein